MQLNTWGVGRRTEIASLYDQEKFPFIEKVKHHFNLEIFEVKGDGHPIYVALGESASRVDSDAVQIRATPFFSSFEGLDYFCQINEQKFLSLDATDGIPRVWFWHE